MRFSFFSAVVLSASLLVQAAPAPSPVEQRDLIGDLESILAGLLSVPTIDLNSVLNAATPIVESVLSEATSIVGHLLVTDTALKQEATSVLADYASAAEATATALTTSVLSDSASADATSTALSSDVLSDSASAAAQAMETAAAKGLDDNKNAVDMSNGAASGQDVRPLSMGAAAVLGSMLLGAYAVL